MPVFSALALLTTSLSGTLGAGGLGLSAAAATATANLIVGTTLSLVSSKLFGPQVQRAPRQDPQAVINQALAARTRGYGRCKLGGVRAFFDSRDGYLYQIVMLHTGEIDAIEQFWIGDKAVTRDDDGKVIDPPYKDSNGRQFVQIWARLGLDEQDAYGDMLAAWPDIWTDAHQLNGIASMLAIFRSPNATKVAKIFPESYNTSLRVVARLSKVYDPRTGKTAWSRNAALCIRDYLTSRDGYRLTNDQIDDESFANFADLCDERVPLKSGDTQARYTIDGTYSLLDEPTDTLDRMRAACDAELYETPEGKIAIRGGDWTPPTVTLTEKEIRTYELQQGSERFTTFNELKITYTSPRHDYQPQEAVRWIDPDDQAVRGVISSSFTVDMAASAAQVRRLAKIYRAKENPKWFGSITTDITGLRARYDRIIRLVIPELGIDGPFLVEDHGILADCSGCTISVRWLGPEAYSWDPATEEKEEAPEAVDTSPGSDLPVPVVTLTQEAGRVVVATAADPGRDLDLDAQIRSGTRWSGMTSDDLTASAEVSAAGTYYVRSRWVAPSGVTGEWAAEKLISVV